ncbi:hypothetical protein [Nostoc sp. NMS1]|uniref:hypothetical protein n=1 Tax=Nostoc sp. NMS1 TaxID=2815388 RepID=UPI0025E688E1|nr:hypothetical protein [Nostoc sp. NMS1]
MKNLLIPFHKKSDTDVNLESITVSKFFNCELRIANCELVLGCSKSPIGSLAHPHPPQLIEDSDMDKNPSILSHVSIGTNDFKRAIAICRSAVPAAAERLQELPSLCEYRF